MDGSTLWHGWMDDAEKSDSIGGDVHHGWLTEGCIPEPRNAYSFLTST